MKQVNLLTFHLYAEGKYLSLLNFILYFSK